MNTEEKVDLFDIWVDQEPDMEEIGRNIPKNFHEGEEYIAKILVNLNERKKENLIWTMPNDLNDVTFAYLNYYDEFGNPIVKPTYKKPKWFSRSFDPTWSIYLRLCHFSLIKEAKKTHFKLNPNCNFRFPFFEIFLHYSMPK
jgi:hypothetical protein